MMPASYQSGSRTTHLAARGKPPRQRPHYLIFIVDLCAQVTAGLTTLPMPTFWRIALTTVGLSLGLGTGALKPLAAQSPGLRESAHRVLDGTCRRCHNDRVRSGDMSVQGFCRAAYGLDLDAMRLLLAHVG